MTQKDMNHLPTSIFPGDMFVFTGVSLSIPGIDPLAPGLLRLPEFFVGKNSDVADIVNYLKARDENCRCIGSEMIEVHP